MHRVTSLLIIIDVVMKFKMQIKTYLLEVLKLVNKY